MSDKQDALGQTAFMAFPLGGIDAEQPFDLQPPGTTPSAVNVCSVDPTSNRARGGSRPGLGRFLPPLPTLSGIQSLDIIVDPQADALTADFGELPIGDLIQFEWIDDPTTGANRYGRQRNLGQVKKGGSGRDTGFSISKSPTKVLWSDPADMTAGEPLSATQLNASAVEAPGGIIAVAGTMEYSPAAGTVLSVGHATLNVKFTPTDEGIYKGSIGRVQVNVVASTPPSPLTYLSSSFASAAIPATTVARILGVEAGDLLIVFIGNSDGLISGDSYTVADNQFNTYTQIESDLEESQLLPPNIFCILSAYWAKVSSSGTLTVTATANEPRGLAITVHRISGQHPTSPIRDSASHSAHEPSTPSVATTTSLGAVSGDMILANFLGTGSLFDPGSGYTGIASGGNGFSERHENVTGAEAATATNNSGSYVAIGVAIAPAP